MAKKVMVTGAGGLIGRAVAEKFIFDGWNVVAAGRNSSRLNAIFGGLMECVEYNALEPVRFDFSVDVIVHCASPASPELFVREPVETMLANILGIRELLDYARRVSASKVVYVSSSEVYGRTAPRATGFREDDYGFVDLLDARSSYPMGKRAAETLCISYANEYGINVSIVRPGHIYGPTASPKDKRVSSAFPWQAARGEPIVLKSSGASRRSYTHANDCASAIMTVVAKGRSAEAYNIANRAAECTIRQMAEIVADAGGVDILTEVPLALEQTAFNPMDNSCLDPSKLEALGWRGEIGYEEGFRSMVADLKIKIAKEIE